MRVLVTGATGTVGSQLVPRLKREGAEVYIVSRNVEKARERFKDSVTAFEWTAPYAEFPAEALVGVDGVINLMGEDISGSRWTAKFKKRIYDSRVVGTERLAEAVQKTGRSLGFFVGSSAIGFYGDRKDEVLTERSVAGTGFLPDVCKAWELASMKVPAQRTVIVRTGVVLSRHGGFLSRLLPIFKTGLGGPAGDGQQWVSWIHIDDLCGLFVKAATRAEARGAWNGCSDHPVKNRELGQAIASRLDKPFGIPAPKFALKLLLGEMAELVLDSARVMGSRANVEGFQFPELDAALKDLL